MNFKEFVDKYMGVLIGILIAVLLILLVNEVTLIKIAIIILGAILGKYVHENKDSVKEKLKNLIDRF